MQEKDKEWWSPQELVLVGIEPPSGWKGKAEGAVTGIYRQRWLWAGDSLWPLMEEPSQLAVIPKGGLWGNKYPVLPFPLAPVSRRSFPLAKHNKRQKARGACGFSHRIQLSGLQRRNGKGGRWYLEWWTEAHRSRFCPWISYSTLRNIPETSSYTCAQGGICKVVYDSMVKNREKVETTILLPIKLLHSCVE